MTPQEERLQRLGEQAEAEGRQLQLSLAGLSGINLHGSRKARCTHFAWCLKSEGDASKEAKCFLRLEMETQATSQFTDPGLPVCPSHPQPPLHSP